MGINSTMASYMALTLSPMITSNSLTRNYAYRRKLNEEFDRIMKRVTLKEFFSKTILK